MPDLLRARPCARSPGRLYDEKSSSGIPREPHRRFVTWPDGAAAYGAASSSSTRYGGMGRHCWRAPSPARTLEGRPLPPPTRAWLRRTSSPPVSPIGRVQSRIDRVAHPVGDVETFGTERDRTLDRIARAVDDVLRLRPGRLPRAQASPPRSTRMTSASGQFRPEGKTTDFTCDRTQGPRRFARPGPLTLHPPLGSRACSTIAGMSSAPRCQEEAL